MKFEQGQSGNPMGRPMGSQNKMTQLAKLLYPHAHALIEKSVELALSGDTVALRLCIERLIPKIKHQDSLNLPFENINSTHAHNLPIMLDTILQELNQQNISTEQAKDLCSLLETQRKLIESSHLSQRLSAIETVLNNRITQETQHEKSKH